MAVKSFLLVGSNPQIELKLYLNRRFDVPPLSVGRTAPVHQFWSQYRPLTMNYAKSLLTIAVTWACCVTALAFPIVWTKSTPNSIGAKVIRDSSGNLYHVTPTGNIFGRQLQVSRYNALGTTAWSITISEPSTSGNQFRVKGLALTSTSLIIVAEERDGGGQGAFVSSRLYGVTLANGSNSFQGTSVLEASAPAATATQFAVIERNTANGNTSVVFRDTGYSIVGTVGLAQSAGVGVITMDSNNFAYTACAIAAGTVQIARCNSAGLTYELPFDVANVNNEQPAKIVVDTTVDRAYVLGFGTWHLPPNDRDITFYMAQASTGGLVLVGSVLNTAGEDDPGDIAVVPGGGFVASGINATVNETVHRRYSQLGNNLWSYTVTQTPAATQRFTATDPDGNFLLLSTSTVSLGSAVKVARVGVANGHALGIQDIIVGPDATPTGLLTDAAGNFYISADTTTSTTFMRAQPAQLTFAGNNVAGGSSVNATVTLAVTNQDEQTWTLTSSNPSVVSVPATLVIPATQGMGTFAMTVNPVTVNTNVTINVRHNGFIAQRVLTVIPSVIQSVAIAPQVVIGGVNTTANLVLNGTAPVGGRTVNLASNKPAVASVPASVSIPAGESTLGVTVTTFGVNSNQGVVITATTGAVSKTAFFAVNAPSLSSIAIAPGSVQGGSNATLTLNINGIAPTGGFSIVLISGAPAVVFLSASASVPAGQVTHNVNVPTAVVTSSLNVTLFATRSGIYKTTTVTVTP